MSSHPGMGKAQSNASTNIFGAIVVVVLVLAIITLITKVVVTKGREAKAERAALKDEVATWNRLNTLYCDCGHRTVERTYRFGDRYAVRLSGEHVDDVYLRIPDYAYEALYWRTSDYLFHALNEVREFEDAAESKPASLDDLRKHATWRVIGKYRIGGGCILRLWGDPGPRKCVRVTGAVYEVLLEHRTINEQLPAIEAASKE